MKSVTAKDFCFCTLALGNKYQLLAIELAQDLKKYAPGIQIVIGTDNPEKFKNCDNVVPFKQYQISILKCFNDKRFVIAESLLRFESVIFVDADTRITNNIPQTIQFSPGITAYSRNMIEHLTQYRSYDLETIKRVASKLNIPTEQVNWIGESLFIVTRDGGKEKEFIKYWAILANYLELKGIHRGEGSILGLAATKVGWTVQNSESFMAIDKTRKHLDASKIGEETTFLESLKKRLGFYYRLNRSRLIALKNFNFYYR